MNAIIRSHAFLMFAYAVATGAFFALLWRDDARGRIRLFLVIFVSLFVGGLVISWAMLPFPVR